MITFALAHAKTCGNGDVFYINDHVDMNQFNNCKVIDGSLHINGQHELGGLYNLKDVTNITGYLYIRDSPEIGNLSALSNIQEIRGERLYFDRYAVYIVDNVYDNSNVSLCWADTIDWSMYTDKEVLVKNNGICLPCHKQCNGCWVAGSPQTCQKCSNYISGITCVEYCAQKTKQFDHNMTCLEYLRPVITREEFSAVATDYDEITVRWTSPEASGGVILSYHLIEFFNKTLDTVHEHYAVFGDDGYDTHKHFTFKTHAHAFETYHYIVAVATTVGYGHGIRYNVIPVPDKPSPPTDARTVFVTPYEKSYLLGVPNMTSPFEGFNASITGDATILVVNTTMIVTDITPEVDYNISVSTLTIGNVSSDPMNITLRTDHVEATIPSLPDGSSTVSVRLGYVFHSNVSYEVERNHDDSYHHGYVQTDGTFNITELEPYTLNNLTISWHALYTNETHTSSTTFRTDVGIPPRPSIFMINQFFHDDEFVTRVGLSWDEPAEIHGPITAVMVWYHPQYPDIMPGRREMILEDNNTATVDIRMNASRIMSLSMHAKIWTDPMYTIKTDEFRWDPITTPTTTIMASTMTSTMTSTLTSTPTTTATTITELEPGSGDILYDSTEAPYTTDVDQFGVGENITTTMIVTTASKEHKEPLFLEIWFWAIICVIIVIFITVIMICCASDKPRVRPAETTSYTNPMYNTGRTVSNPTYGSSSIVVDINRGGRKFSVSSTDT